MSHTPDIEERILISALGVLAGIVYLFYTRRACFGHSRAAGYLVGIGSLILAAVVGFALVQPTIGYAFVCFLMVLAYVVDLVQDERERRRRVASLVPRSRAEFIPTLWTSIAALSAGMIVPFALVGRDVIAAVVVGVCTLSMAAIAWRLASAPLQLAGEDPTKERIEERASRAIRSGVSSALAVAIIFVFSSFSLKGVSTGFPVEHEILTLSFTIWIAIGLATVLYAWSIKRTLRGKAA